MKVKNYGKRIFGRRKNLSRGLPMPSEITENGLTIWKKLPERIRQDPCLSVYQIEHDRSAGSNTLDTDMFQLSSHQNGNLGSIQTNDSEFQQRPIDCNEDRIETEQDQAATSDNVRNSFKNKKVWFNYGKIVALLAVWVFFTGFLIATNEKVIETLPMSIPLNKPRIHVLTEVSLRFGLSLKGAFQVDPYKNTSGNILTVNIQSRSKVNNTTDWEDIADWEIPVVATDVLETSGLLEKEHVFDLVDKIGQRDSAENLEMRIMMATNFVEVFAFQFDYDKSPVNKTIGIYYAAIVLIGLYVLIIWDIVDRTFATIIASTLCISVLAAMGARPTMSKVMSWIDIETLLLLFGMMIVVGILSETGLFDYLAVYAYKITNGKPWPLIYCLCFFTAILSAFLDNVTTLLLMAPVSIRLCEIMGLNPVPILISMVLYSNIGGALTPVGDPPNIIIISNSFVQKSGITFTLFIVHMILGVVLASIQAFFQLRFKFRTINDLRSSEPKDVHELRDSIAVWQDALDSLSLDSCNDDFIRWTLVEKVKNLNYCMKQLLKSGAIPAVAYIATLEELQTKYPIKNKSLLIKSGIALTFVLGFFFLHSIPELQRLSLGWTAFLGALLLLILSDKDNMEAVLEKVEWSTLIFFAALFVLIEALSELGLIDWIGNQTEMIILSVREDWRLAVAILIILWISAIASAFIDNIPLTTMMIKITVSLAQNEALGLPLQPLIWALALGACFGGNGTLIGASANIICAGVAEQHGYKFTFGEYFKIGFPMMIGNVLIATAYLMVAHILLQWH